MFKPTLPAVGDTVTLFGLTGQVHTVEPDSDWFWHVSLVFTNTAGGEEFMTIKVPTDFRTTDGQPAY